MSKKHLGRWSSGFGYGDSDSNSKTVGPSQISTDAMGIAPPFFLDIPSLRPPTLLKVVLSLKTFGSLFDKKVQPTFKYLQRVSEVGT
jgi:hypothetical protein